MRDFLLLSTAVMIPAVAHSATLPLQTHTHNTPVELVFISPLSGTEIKLAAVCFLGDDCGDTIGYGKGDEDMAIDTAKQCQNEGYAITSCPLPGYPSVDCPYNDAYFAKCVEDKPRACREAGYGETACDSGEVVNTTCPYDNSFKTCKCNPCAGYDYTYEQATATGYVTDGSCMSCAVTKYKRKINPCSGYSTCECGGAPGAAVCYSGSVQKFNNCKPCCDPNCPAGTTETSPGGCGGSTQNGCRTKTCYYGYQSCFRPYVTDCCDNVTGCKGPGFCNTRVAEYCSDAYQICRERGGVPHHIYCYSPGYTNYDNHGMNAYISCDSY